ncbi:probable sodium-coupled neutral amino acid transporter 6 [Bactrocera neohumeralis]|uniref:probable sodium-coupled neutral amino acid transporter 6 n=1 Tax=Bactrocera neohumeralis TaxID=98809 RepID=UPI0021663853|nr:probable sodium-coupled neutral amino acid transporter 6 [Bactrocera neohumeralis]
MSTCQTTQHRLPEDAGNNTAAALGAGGDGLGSNESTALQDDLVILTGDRDQTDLIAFHLEEKGGSGLNFPHKATAAIADEKLFLHDGTSENDSATEPIASTAAAHCRKRNCFSPILDFVEVLIPYGGLLSNVFSLGSVTLGGGIISMPSSFQTSGILMAVIYLLVINVITIYTIVLMGYAIKITGFRNYEEMALGLFGRGWDYFVGFIVWLSCFGTAVAYISAVTSLLLPILEHAPHTPEYLKTDSGQKLLTSMVWLGLMLPVVIPKRVNSVRYVSAIGVSFVLYFVVCVVVHSCMNGVKLGMRGNMRYFTSGNEAIYGLSIFVFSFLSQCITYPVYLEQRPKPSIKQLTIAAALSMSICMVFYIFVGVFGYFDFADDTKAAVLENFDPVHQPYIMVAYVGMLIKICAAYSMNMIPCRDFVYYCLKWDLDTNPYWKHIIAITIMALVTLICGLFIPSINLALGLVGSLCGGFIGFIFPVLFWMYCGNWSLRTVGIWHYLACYFCIIGGVIAIVWGTIATIYSSFFDV